MAAVLSVSPRTCLSGSPLPRSFPQSWWQILSGLCVDGQERERPSLLDHNILGAD